MKQALIALALVAAAGCAGNKARKEALIPAVEMAWPHVMAAVDRGVADSQEVGGLSDGEAGDLRALAVEIGDALAARDLRALRGAPHAFAQLEPWAMRGIQARVDAEEISEGVAESLRERVRNVRLSLEKIAERRLFSSRRLEPYRTPVEELAYQSRPPVLGYQPRVVSMAR